MPDEIKVTRPMQPQNQPRPEYSQPMNQMAELPAPASRMPWIILGVIIVLLAAAGVVFRGQLFGRKSGGAAAGTNYQAVFLTNGQVYFGRLSEANRDYLKLDDIYYLQVVQPPLQGQQQPGQQQQTQTQQPQISLIKLGNELHGPVDEMHISRQQILFYEDLKEDGQVVKAIIQDKNNKK